MRISLIQVLAIGLAVTVANCGPAARNQGGNGADARVGPDAFLGVPAVITGKVWAPNQGPGQAAPGQEIPIFGAVIYASVEKPEGIPPQAYCDKCVDTPVGVTSSHDGGFSLSVPPGTYWLTIQKGQFRLEQRVTVAEGPTVLPANQTTLPTKYDPANGQWIPKIAIVRGGSDNIQDVMGKLGFGTMSGNSWSNANGENGTEMDIYDWGTFGGGGSVDPLLRNIANMRKYHIIFFPCSTSVADNLLNQQDVLKNIRQYVNEGGKIYLTDWSGEVADFAFPHQIELGDSGADSEGTYDPITFTGKITTQGDADGSSYSNNDGKAVDPDLATWLGLQIGPNENSPPGMYNPQAFEVTDNWNWIRKLNPVLVGNDSAGMPVYDEPRAWMIGSNGRDNILHPQAVTYQPTGCGKVLYSTFQTSNASHPGMYAQERILLYLIMEIQQCSDTPVVE
jgi:hypothetical protein